MNYEGNKKHYITHTTINQNHPFFLLVDSQVISSVIPFQQHPDQNTPGIFQLVDIPFFVSLERIA